MYFPYLRGRQYELLGLRELLENNRLSNKVIPIIEPVKASPTLLKTLNAFIKKEMKIAVINNPIVGDFDKEILKLEEKKQKEFSNILESPYIIPAYLVTRRAKLDEMKKEEREFIAVCKNLDDVELFKQNDNGHVLYSAIPDSNIAKRRLSCEKIILSDKFNKLEKNASYQLNDDEFFSADYLYYEEDGYNGFSDYSIVGDEYSEAGFAPFAVAIHMVYFQNNELRVHHFVSDSNDDITDPQGKFGEALKKLINYQGLQYSKNNSYALNRFKELYSSQEYPGLGSVKKLSIMHHLELVSNYLEGKS